MIAEDVRDLRENWMTQADVADEEIVAIVYEVADNLVNIGCAMEKPAAAS